MTVIFFIETNKNITIEHYANMYINISVLRKYQFQNMYNISLFKQIRSEIDFKITYIFYFDSP